MVLVLTIDQRASRTADDGVPALLAAMRDELDASQVDVPATPSRTAGDELQIALTADDDALRVVPALLEHCAAGGWWVGVAVGPATLAATSAASRGPAFYAARRAVERAKSNERADSGIALGWSIADDDRARRLDAGDAAPSHAEADLLHRAAAADAILQAYAHWLQQRTGAGVEALTAVRRHGSQARAAGALGISQQAVAARLAAARWRLGAQLAAAVPASLAVLVAGIEGVEAHA